MLPTVLVQWTIFHWSDSVFPLVASLEVASLHDTSAGEAQQSWVNVSQSLCDVATHAILTVFECVNREEAYMLKVNRIGRGEEDAKVCLVECAWGIDYHLILLPIA